MYRQPSVSTNITTQSDTASSHHNEQVTSSEPVSSSSFTNIVPSNYSNTSHPSPSVDQFYRTSYTPEQSSNNSKLPVAPKRLHISNIPFKYREADLRQLFSVSKLHFSNFF